MDIKTIEKRMERIHKFMRDNYIIGGVVDYNKHTKMIAVEVINGDWKHQHYRLDYFMQIGFDLRSIVTQTTEEDGSDCYSAVHYYYFN